jgi:hypothetical protein
MLFGEMCIQNLFPCFNWVAFLLFSLNIIYIFWTINLHQIYNLQIFSPILKAVIFPCLFLQYAFELRTLHLLANALLLEPHPQALFAFRYF